MAAIIIPVSSPNAFAFDYLSPLIALHTSHFSIHTNHPTNPSSSALQEHRSKLLVAAVLILSLCFTSILLVGLAKLYHYYYQPAHQHQHTALPSPNTDRDTLSSRGSASLVAQEFLQLEPASESGAGLEGHYGSVKSATPRQPRGILKQSRTLESLTYCANSSLTLYSNPALEPQCSPLRLQDPEAMLERQVVVSTLERQALGSPIHNWQQSPDPPGFPFSEPQASPRQFSEPQHQPRGCRRVSQTSLLCSMREGSGKVQENRGEGR